MSVFCQFSSKTSCARRWNLIKYPTDRYSLTPKSRMDNINPKIKKAAFFAPYRQSEMSLYASAMASFLIRKIRDIRSWTFEYITYDPVCDYCSPLVDSSVQRVVSPSDFAFHLNQCRVVYWFDLNKEYLKSAYRCKNYLFTDYTKWDSNKIFASAKYSNVMFPAKEVTARMFCLTSCLSVHTIYPGSYKTIAPMRYDLIDRNRMGIVLSMCGIQNPKNRLGILQNIENTVKNRNDLFITLLMDGWSFAEERQLIEKLGLEYSDKCLVLNTFSDYEYFNILQQNDLFLDLNPANGIGYLLTAALHQGLLVGGFDQKLYRDILDGGNFGMLIKGDTKEYGFQFDRVDPKWDNVFRLLNERVFVVRNILSLMEKRNDCSHLLTTLEARVHPFLEMFHYIVNPKIRHYSFAD